MVPIYKVISILKEVFCTNDSFTAFVIRLFVSLIIDCMSLFSVRHCEEVIKNEHLLVVLY